MRVSTRALTYIGLAAAFAFLAAGILSPNPFGNNPDVIYDESYFLTSSLSSFEQMTIPGWEFSPSGAYYGGPQTYVDWVVLMPVVGAVFVAQHFSKLNTEAWAAVHTGDLLHVLRLVSGALALATIAWCFFYFRRKKIPAPLARSLWLWLFLLLSTVLVIQFFHTAKMWTVYVLVLAVLSAFFIAEEHYLTRFKSHFLTPSQQTALYLWSGALAFFQNYFGVFSVLFLAVYALYLGHFDFGDVLRCIKRYWYWVVLFGLTQLSFVYRSLFVTGYSGFSNMSAKSGAHIDWYHRLYDPLVFAVTGQPLMVIFFALIAAAAVLVYRGKDTLDAHAKKLILVASVHPLIVYLFFHVAVGMSIAPRYGIMLTMAFTFSIVLLLTYLDRRLTSLTLAASVILFAVINMHAIALYWQPSSETDLLTAITARYDTPNTVFIEDSSALRLTLPVNAASLPYLGHRADFLRFKFLQQHPDLADALVPFKPIAITTYGPDEETAAIARFATSTDSVWLITGECSQACTAAESAAGSCLEFNTSACGEVTQEPNGLPVFLSATQLGRSFVVRKLK